MNETKEKLLDKLHARLDHNLADFREEMLALDPVEIYERSGEINATKDVYFYLTDVMEFEPDEVNYLLLFEKPLEVVADAWWMRCEDISDMSFALENIFDNKNHAESYALVNDKQEKQSIRAQLAEKQAQTDGTIPKSTERQER